MRGIKRIDVVIPARNEERFIGACLQSVERSIEFARRGSRTSRLEFAVTVVADSCSDSTVSIAQAFAGVRVETVSVECVGAARAHGVSSALALSPLPDDRRWVANTDADSTVPVNWLSHQLELADAGHDLIVGTVRPPPADLSEEQWAVWREHHIPGRPNGHVHGANLGFRLDRYVDCGGYRRLPEHEDNDLVTRLTSAGARTAPTDGAEVVTSGRRLGRTPGGYAGFLRLLDESAAHQRGLRVDVDD